ncbi:aspartate aminotransferase family protein [Bdellovibrio sp. qaytius]|nr:aspartate aminotransferase family protein [Bdellovibrio sp. qaytius]
MTNMTSENYFERAKNVAPGGVHSPVRSFAGLGRSPVFFSKAQGAYLTSVENKKYIDCCQSFGPLILGHRDPEVQAKVMEMIDTAWTFGACEPYSLMLGEWIQSRVPWVEKLRFVSSGTEAVMSALRVARAATGRTKILKFEGCYHGHVDSLLVKAGSGLAGETASSSAGVSAQTAAETLTVSLDDENALAEVFAREGKNIAALIMEPLPANYGLLIQRKEFIQKACDLAKANGALVIFDEVISGFRVAVGGMAEILNIKPDLVTYGKILGGGFPVGMYGGRRDLMDLIAPLGQVYQAGTLSANPVGMVAGLATLEKMERVDGWKVLESRGQLLENKVNDLIKNLNLPLTFVRYGSLFWLHNKTADGKPLRQVEQIPAGQKETFKKLFLNSLDRGLYLAPNAYEVGFLSMAHTEEVINDIVKIMGESLA